ncbi:GntR family transcriptional regulator [Serpentinicella alkaliphila]|uniref:GntR family transcriptional regulator n=1 Tax=Serpentinicella alkaliphila TaxID=1734049 RepID=A0A4R2TY92_9FIRM|nr:GntR family transcriptional regulator [Serpentinicella alkaliphila]QUH26831.1 GntR family transcriptional regulator [Serpentinicella alkaliphila]TCQ08057.1 GntR family transcriptional regulator [Serpentinicella alkaliphila]
MNLEVEKQRSGMTVGDYVYEVIKRNIINLNMPPGTRVSEKEISDLLKVSRTPVREAFIKLSKEGLLYILPQRGTYISYIDLDVVENARFIRECLELAVLKIATEKFPEELLNVLQENINEQRKLIDKRQFFEFLEMDEEFHKTIFIGCNKERTWSFIQQINTEYKRTRMLTFIADVNWKNVIDQHLQILESIKTHNEQMGQEVIYNHIQKLIFEQEELKQKYPEYFNMEHKKNNLLNFI